MTLPLELGGIQDGYVRRAFEQISQQPPIADKDISSTASIQESKLASGATGLAKGAFSAYRNAALSLATGAAITFDTEEFDVSGWHDTTNGKFTPLTAGIYRMNAAVQMNGGAASVAAQLRKNGAVWKIGSFATAAANNGLSVVTALVQANGTTDAFDVSVLHTGVGAQALAVGQTSVYFMGELVGRP